MERIGYLGPEGSYSFIAAKLMRPKAQLIPYASFPLVMASLVSGETNATVIPIENSLNGGVMQNIDLLQSTAGVCAVEEYILKIEHCLVTKRGATYGGIRKIYSHPQALEQCAGYLSKNFPAAALVAVNSTSASLDMVKTDSEAAIAGAHCLREGLTVAASNVADEENNFTHFLLIRKGLLPEIHSERIFFSAECPNKSGALLTLLNIISRHGINMTKLQSRPVKNLPEQYRFFIEIEGDYSSGKVKAALEDIENSAISFKLLGCY